MKRIILILGVLAMSAHADEVARLNARLQIMDCPPETGHPVLCSSTVVIGQNTLREIPLKLVYYSMDRDISVYEGSDVLKNEISTVRISVTLTQVHEKKSFTVESFLSNHSVSGQLERFQMGPLPSLDTFPLIELDGQRDVGRDGSYQYTQLRMSNASTPIDRQISQ